ncbi:MAG TPA: M20 family metallopeptidase [Nocardioidaceae bacterium]
MNLNRGQATEPTTLRLARELGPELAELRRALHQIPEVGLDLPLTQRMLLDALAGLDLEVSLGKELSSITAVLRGRAPAEGERQVVLLRGDMDALPVTEEVDLDYRSRHDGVMHACGHDLHMAGLVGAARILHALRDELPGDVVFMFQPGEEGPGGAEPMIREGLLDVAGRRVDAAYALHVSSSDEPFGQWFSRRGTSGASADSVTVRVLGTGGHGSAPYRARDPIPAMCEMVLALQTMTTRGFDVFDPIVVTVGRIAGGTKENIIPDEAEFEATVRSLSPQSRAKVRADIQRLVGGIAAAHGLAVAVDYELGYPVTVNDDTEYAHALQVVDDLFGRDRFTELPTPELGSEDMAFVMELVPSAYFNVSACPVADYANAPDNHSPRAAFDDAVLPDAAAWLAEVAVRRLRRATPGPDSA